MTALRQRYLRDLALRGLALRTQEAYTAFVADLARHYQRSPDLLDYDQVADWLFHLLRERKLAASSVNIAINAVRTFYGLTLRRDLAELQARVPRLKRGTKRAHATHLIESGVEITLVQRLLGHASLATTARYLHTTAPRLDRVRSALDLIDTSHAGRPAAGQ